MTTLRVVYKGGEKGIVEKIKNLEIEVVKRKGDRKENKKSYPCL